jgi:hypothetical protein
MNNKIAMLLCLLMVSAPMAGCVGGNDESNPDNEELSDDWNVHFAATAADLPTCDETTNGRLYYIESGAQFQVCKTTGWEIISIQGPVGANVLTALMVKMVLLVQMVLTALMDKMALPELMVLTALMDKMELLVKMVYQH